MKRFSCRTTTHNILATIVFVACGAATSWAHPDVIGARESGPCPWSEEAAVHLPDSIQVEDDLRPRIDVMLQKSATFRSQCRRLAQASRLYVRVRVDLSIANRPYRAVTSICRQSSGAIVASIALAGIGDPVEWLAHEFEHLIEQLDGVNLRDLERRRQGAWRSGNAMFETERAIRVGRRVLHEIRGAAPRPARGAVRAFADVPALSHPLTLRTSDPSTMLESSTARSSDDRLAAVPRAVRDSAPVVSVEVEARCPQEEPVENRR